MKVHTNRAISSAVHRIAAPPCRCVCHPASGMPCPSSFIDIRWKGLCLGPGSGDIVSSERSSSRLHVHPIIISSMCMRSSAAFPRRMMGVGWGQGNWLGGVSFARGEDRWVLVRLCGSAFPGSSSWDSLGCRADHACGRSLKRPI